MLFVEQLPFRYFIPATVLFAVFAACLFGCSQGLVEDSGSCTLYVEANGIIKSYEVDLSKVSGDDGLFAILEYLKSEGELDYTYSDSTYGAYLLSVGDAVPATDSEYISIYTTYESDFDTSAYFKSLEYNEKSFGTSGLGASSMSVPDGSSFYILVESYGG